MAKEIKVAELPEGVTAEMIAAWKERYGQDKVKIASLPKDDDGLEFFECVVRVPDRKTQGEFEKWLDKNMTKSKDILINACVLTGKDQIKADDGLYAAAFDAVSQLLVFRTAIIKNC